MILKPGAHIGPYRIVSAIGHGGVGEVYLAEDPRLQRQVAIKVLNAQHAEKEAARDRFLREARMAAALDHPNVCTLHAIDSDGAVDYIVMQRLEGETLRERLDRGRPGAAEADAIALQLADALAYAHTHGVIHRDIKPQNVMLTAAGVKLMDFGLAKAAGRLDAVGETHAALTRTGTFLGTIAYMAPEQLEGRPADERSDIFSLGVTLYELFAGVHPFAGPTAASTISAILSRSAAPLSAVAPDVPAALAGVVEKALKIDPQARYRSATDLLVDLRSAVQRDARPAARVGSPARRGRAGWWIGAAVIAGATAWAGWRIAYPRVPAAPPAATARPAAAASTLTAWLEVQPVRAGIAGRPYESSGGDTLLSRWKFRVHAVPAAPGSIYIVSDEHALASASSEVTLLYPPAGTPSGVQGVLTTDWYVIGGAAADTSLWVLWSREAIGELDALTPLVTAASRGIVRQKTDAEGVRRMLMSASAHSTASIDEAHRVMARSPEGVVAYRFSLRQR